MPPGRVWFWRAKLTIKLGQEYWITAEEEKVIQDKVGKAKD